MKILFLDTTSLRFVRGSDYPVRCSGLEYPALTLTMRVVALRVGAEPQASARGKVVLMTALHKTPFAAARALIY